MAQYSRMRDLLLLLLLVPLLAGCSGDPALRLPGVWSNGDQGKILDITPNGLFAEVWMDSEARLAAWSLEGDDLSLKALCSTLDPEPKAQPFSFLEDTLTFPEANGRFSRFVQEPRQPVPAPGLVGLWSRKTEAHKIELIEFTPWSTVIWNRWEGEAGKQVLLAGWAALSTGNEPGLLFSGVEGDKLLKWSQPVPYQSGATKITLQFPDPVGEKVFFKADSSEAQRAATATTR